MYRPPFGSDTFQKLLNQHILPAQCPALFPGLEPCARAAPLLDVCKPAEHERHVIRGKNPHPVEGMHSHASALARLRKDAPADSEEFRAFVERGLNYPPAEPSDKMTLTDALAKLREPCPGTKIGISLDNPGIHDRARKSFEFFIHTLFPHAFSLRSVSDDTTRKTCTNTRGAECFRRASATVSAGKS
jgi:hypothetical protein